MKQVQKRWVLPALAVVLIVIVRCALGGGIISMIDLAAGTYQHVLGTDFTLKDAQRIVYYNGEANFALEYVQRNLVAIQVREMTSPTDLELLMAAFELYDRMMNMDASVEGFDQDSFLTVLRERADR